MRWVVLLVLGCACPDKPATVGPGSGSAPPVASATCDEIRAHVEQLYRGEIQRDDLVADNVAMVMTDCRKQPARVAGCAATAKSVSELEKTCLIPLDPEGSEGMELKK